MVNPQLLQYIRAQRAAGVSKEEIVKALAGGGWSASDAQEAFAAIETPTPPPAAAAPKPPAPIPAPAPASSGLSAMATMSPAMQPRPAPASPPLDLQPVSVRPQPVAVVQPRPAYAPQPKRRSRWPWILLGLILFFVLGVAAGAYVAVTNEMVGSIVSGIAGVEQPFTGNENGLNMVANEGDEGGFLEVSPEPFDTSSTAEENSTSTPATGTATSTTATSTATSTSGR